MAKRFKMKKERIDLVGVHVTLRSTASLEDDQRKMIR